MSHRYVPLASLLCGMSFMGCVIYTEPQDRPPPPPPPPHQAQPAPPPPAQPAQPGKTGYTRPPNAPPPGGGVGAIDHHKFTKRLAVGEILVTVTGGSCDIGVDGKSQGVKSEHRMTVGAGNHTVTCTPVSKATLTQQVAVQKNEQVTVNFDLTNPANTTTSKKPVNIAPPVGRPTPGQ